MKQTNIATQEILNFWFGTINPEGLVDDVHKKQWWIKDSEDFSMQKRSIELFEKLLQEAPVSQKDLFNAYLDYAKQHAAIIEKFNCFPHRNKILNRESTAGEIEFLTQPGSSF